MTILIGKGKNYDFAINMFLLKNILILSFKHIFTMNVYHLHNENGFLKEGHAVTY